MSTLNLKNINKIYDNNVQAVFDFNLDIKDKEFIVFVGPSGCGKSTTLRMVAGLEDITSGELYIDGKLVNTVEPKNRDIAMVFQNYALYPHMTVYDNMAFALKLRKLPMPLYEENGEVDGLIEVNKVLWNKVHALNRKFKKNQNDLSILEPRGEILKQIYDNLNKIESLRKPIVGRNEYQIAKINSALKQLETEVAKLNNMAAGKYAQQPDMLKIIKDGVEQRTAEIEKLHKELEYFENNDTPLTKLRKLTAREIEVEINKTADSIDLTRYLFRKPSALSGGQRQRVALGRAIVRKPKVFLMDEPLSNLDAKLRVQTRSEITKIHERVGATTIYVTHDQTEAMTMADRIVIMKDGWIQQIGTPDEVYSDPANMFVGGFIGSPAMNFIECRYTNGKIEFLEKTAESENLLSATSKKVTTKITLNAKDKKLFLGEEGKEIVLGVRPETIYLKNDKNNEHPSEPVKVNCDFAELLGYELILYTYINGQKVIGPSKDIIEVKNAIEAYDKINTHDDITICFDKEQLYFFDKETGARIK